jgi:maleylacetoacetate isomerase
MNITLYDYWRSSASYRVRIALNLKSLAYQSVSISLIDGEQKSADYKAKNPQGFVPMLSIDGHNLTQSLAIIEYLDRKFPKPRLFPTDPIMRAQTMTQVMIIAADIHPIDNLRVLHYLRDQMGQDQAAIDDWYRHWIIEGFNALEQMAPDIGLFGGEAPNAADIFLVPQMANARRLETPLATYPKLVRIDAALCAMPAFANAHPDMVKPET